MENENKPSSQENPPSLEEQINQTLAKADDKGIIDFGENPDPVFKKLVLTEKKARQHQAKAIKTARELAAATAAKDELEKLAVAGTSISAEQQEELDSLKFEDPDTWFQLKSQYEKEARTQSQQKIQEVTSAASEKAVQELSIVERTEALQAFTSSTGIELTDDVMMNDIPPRLQQKMGSMPFEEYLQEVATYLGKGKVVKPTDEGLNQTDINKLSGSTTVVDSYEPDLGDGII